MLMLLEQKLVGDTHSIEILCISNKPAFRV